MISQGLSKGFYNVNPWQVLFDATIGGISGALGTSAVSGIVSIIAGGVIGAVGSVGSDLLANNGDWSKVDIVKAIFMSAIGILSGKITGAGTQNTKAMVKAINNGKSWGSKAFLLSANEALLRPNSGLVLQTMYMNMEKAITLYTIEGITKISCTIFMSTFIGNLI